MSSKRAQKEQIQSVADELTPYFENRVLVDKKARDALSQSALEAWDVADNIRQLALHLNGQAEACYEGEGDLYQQRSRAATTLISFLDALLSGKSHPLLDYWNSRRRMDPAGAQTDRPLIGIIRRQAAICATALANTRKLSTRMQCRELVSKLLKETGVLETCRPTAIKNWEASLGPADIAMAEEMRLALSNEPKNILGAFRDFLHHQGIDLSGGRKARAVED